MLIPETMPKDETIGSLGEDRFRFVLRLDQMHLMLDPLRMRVKTAVFELNSLEEHIEMMELYIAGLTSKIDRTTQEAQARSDARMARLILAENVELAAFNKAFTTIVTEETTIVTEETTVVAPETTVGGAGDHSCEL